MKVKCLQCSF